MAKEALKKEVEEVGNKQYIIVNKNKCIVKINGVILNVGANIINDDQLKKLNQSPYFKLYFKEEIEKLSEKEQGKCAQILEFKKGFSPDDLKNKKENSAIADLIALDDLAFKKAIEDIYSFEVLKDLEAATEKGAKLSAIQDQLKKITPNQSEIKN